MRKNAFTAIAQEGLPDLPELVYLNYRENELTEIDKFSVLSKYEKLSKVVVTENPLKSEPSGEVKKEMLIALPQLKFIGKDEIAPEEREDAINEAAERKRLAEEAKLEAEKAANEAAEAPEENQEEEAED